MANPSLDRASAERALADRPRESRSGTGTLSAAQGAVDYTLGRPEDRRRVVALFWFLVLGPALLAGVFVSPLVGVALLPLQVLAAILVGTAVARWRQCGPVTLASMPLSAIGLVWIATILT